MNKLEQRIKRIEGKASVGRCSHPVGILVDPTEEELEKVEKKIAACPNCNGDGPGPRLVIVRLTRFARGKP